MNVSITTGFTCFNSTLVQLKAILTIVSPRIDLRFNSTLVQLKVESGGHVAPVDESFNSTLVQLKDQVQ